MSSRTRRGLAGFLVVGVAFLGSCGSGDASGTSSTSTTEAAQETATTGADQITTTTTETDIPVTVKQLVGSWQLAAGEILTFDDAGTWEITEGDTPDEPFDGGTYQLVDSTLTLESTFGDGCEIGATGNYELAEGPEDGEITALSVEPRDPCEQRRAEMERGLQPVEP